MLQIDKVQLIDDFIVYGDHDHFNVFYVLPQQPRYRLNTDGTPSFRFLKYRFPVDRPGGKKGGGFLLFDVEFVVDEAKLPAVKEALANQVRQEANRLGIDPVPEVIFGTVTYTKGETKLFVAGSDGTFVEKLNNPGKPSLFGNNISTFALELSSEGATFFEQAMQGGGGSVSVVYDLWFWARMPDCTIDAYFWASKFYSFYQTIDTDWHLWDDDSYRETVREQMISSESMYVEPNFPASMPQKMQDQLRDWATRALEDAVERNMIEAIAPVSDDQRKAPEDIEDVTRDITSVRISNVSIHYKESQTVEWNEAPQGILQNITQLKDANGAALKWSDYSAVIDLDDPFFRQLRVDAYVNADFADLHIHSVEVKLLYKGRPMANLAPDEPEGEIVLNSPDDVGKFATFVEGDDWKYKYSYQVNYRGQSKTYQSPEIETNEGNLTIGVDDVGILGVDVAAGDINWDEVDRAQVTFQYEDTGVDLIERQLPLTKDTPTAKIQEVIFQPMRKNYRYRVKYFMKGGKEFEGSEMEARSPRLFINDAFGGRKSISVRGVGDFANRIQNVFVDLEYDDQNNDYQQTKTQALNSASQFFDWVFPVISEKNGKVTYSATIAYKNGTSDSIPKTVAESDTIILPPAIEAFLEVQLVTDLINWDQVKLVRASLSYHDSDGGVSAAQDFIFSPTNKANTTWKVELKNKERDQYTYQIVYFLADNLQKSVGPIETKDRSLVLDPRS